MRAILNANEQTKTCSVDIFALTDNNLPSENRINWTIAEPKFRVTQCLWAKACKCGRGLQTVITDQVKGNDGVTKLFLGDPFDYRK